MKVFRQTPPPAENSSPDDLRRWADQIAKCAISCAKTFEARKIRPNEFPLVIGSLVKGFCDQTGVPLDTVIDMIRRAAVADELPETSPADENPPDELPEVKHARVIQGKYLAVVEEITHSARNFALETVTVDLLLYGSGIDSCSQVKDLDVTNIIPSEIDLRGGGNRFEVTVTARQMGVDEVIKFDSEEVPS